MTPGRHLLELLNEILDLSKIEAGRMELELGARRRWSAALERGADHGARARRAARRSTLSLEVEPGVDAIVADELRFKQVILNLLTNAVKFTPDGGAVEVKARRLDGEVDATVTRHRASASPRATRRGSSSRSSRAVAATRQRGGHRARPHPLAAGSSSSTAGGCGSRASSGAGSTFGFAIPLRAAATGAGGIAPAAPTPRAATAARRRTDDPARRGRRSTRSTC